MKSASDESCGVSITFNNSTPNTTTISTATEMYYSLSSLVGTGSGTLSITNNGEGILSLTKLMAVTPPSTQSNNAPRRFLSVNEGTLSNALASIAMLEADLSIDEETIETASSDDGTVTITLQTSEDAETIVVRDGEGNVVDPDSIEFTIDETGVKNWTIVLADVGGNDPGAPGTYSYTYTLQAEYENGYAPEEPTTVTVTVTIPEQEAEEQTVDFGTSKFGKLFARLIELIRMIISLFS